MEKAEMIEALEEALERDRGTLKSLLSQGSYTESSRATMRTHCRQHMALVELLLTLLHGTDKWFELEEEGVAWSAFQHVLEHRNYCKVKRK